MSNQLNLETSRPPDTPVNIAPWPEPRPDPRFHPVGQAHGRAPEETDPTPASPADARRDITVVKDPILTIPIPAPTAMPTASQARSTPPTGPPCPLTTPDSQPRLPCRGHQPITTRNLDPTIETTLEMAIAPRLEGFDELTIPNAFASQRFSESFVSRKFVRLLGLELQNLGPTEIRRILTPRGSIRCTETVVLIFRLPGLDPPGLRYFTRVLVLPEGHPDPGVPLIIGLPWLNHQHLIQRSQNRYVPMEYCYPPTGPHHVLTSRHNIDNDSMMA